jgi:Ca2+:H+ antiporter
VTRVLLIAATFALAAIAGVLHYATNEDVATFVVCALSLAGLAWIVAIGTESVGARFGPAATGILQSTLGNLPELFVVVFALSAGETVVAQTSILGSLFANALLVLGLSIVAGATVADGSCMRFGQRLPNDTAVLTLLAVFIIVLLGVSDRVAHAAAEEESSPALAFPVAIGLLTAAGVGAALVSDWFISALDPAVKSLGISKAFTGLVIVGIAGNAVENAVGVTLAAKGKSDLALSVIKNSVSQIAVLLYPALVLISLFFAHRLTFVVNPVLTGALALTALAMWGITGDGKAAAFEGWALVGFYVILAALVWYE